MNENNKSIEYPFKVNGQPWLMKYVEPWHEGLEMGENDYRFGMCRFSEGVIYIADNLNPSRTKQTITHEVTHVFINEHGMYCFDSFNHEQLCEFMMAHSFNICKVVDDIVKFLKGVK